MSGRGISLRLNSQPARSVHAGRQVLHLGHWNNRPCNQISIIRQFEGNDRFHFQDVTTFFIDPGVRVEIIF